MVIRLIINSIFNCCLTGDYYIIIIEKKKIQLGLRFGMHLHLTAFCFVSRPTVEQLTENYV